MKERTNKQLNYIRENLEYVSEYDLNKIISEINLAIIRKETLFHPTSNFAVTQRDEQFNLEVTSKKDLLKQAADFQSKIFGTELRQKEYNFIGHFALLKNTESKSDSYRMIDKYGIPTLCRILYYVIDEDVDILDNKKYTYSDLSNLLKDLYDSYKDRFSFQLPDTNFIIEKFANGNITIKGFTDKQRVKFNYMIDLKYNIK